MKSHRVPLALTIVAMVLLFGSQSMAQEAASDTESGITFGTSALERILADPQLVLDQEESFWTEEAVQRLAQGWIDEVTPDKAANARQEWREGIAELAKLSPEERANHPFTEMTDHIKANAGKFNDSAFPHLMSYIPETDRRLDRPILFTLHIPPRAFATSEGVVINLESNYWKGNPDNILNCIVHELFHTCYAWFRPTRTETPVEHEYMYKMMESLQNEGLAMYVAYHARSIFPAPDEKDYHKFESEEDVTTALEQMNALFDVVGKVEPKILRRFQWKVGTGARAYYVAGAHMADVIETKLGREGLLETISAGPRTFIERYNTLVEDDRKIVYPDATTIAARLAELDG